MRGKSKTIVSQVFLSIGALLIFVSIAQAAGTTGAQFLKIGVGARAAGMGDAYSGVANDVTAGYWNPAGLSQIENPQISVMQNSGLVGSQFQYLAGLMPLNEKNKIAVSLYRMDYGTIDRYSAGDVQQGSFEAGDLAAGISWAHRLDSGFSVGLTGKFLQETIETEKASGFASDAGLFYKKDRNSFGLALANFGSSIKFVNESEDLPQTVRLGAARQFLHENLLVSAQISKPSDNDVSYHAGTEYKLIDRVFLRGGYQTTPGNSLDVDGLKGLCGGLGFTVGLLSIDYAITPFGDLGNTHKISLLLNFDRP